MAHTSRLRAELLSRRERHFLAQAQFNRDEMTRYKGWPMCATCMLPVRAYGLEHETDYALKFWARCRHDGRDCWDERYIRKPSKDIAKRVPSWFSNSVKMLCFFVREF
jgi:hypothetical protein